MFSKRVLALLALVVALGVVLGGAVGFASPKDGPNNKERTQTVLIKSRQATVVDVGQKGPSQGDTRVVNAPLYDKSGKVKVGRIDVYCVATDPADRPNEKVNMAECTYAFTLEKFEGARGETSVETHGKRTFFTFHFID